MNNDIYALSYGMKLERNSRIFRFFFIFILFFAAVNAFFSFLITPVKQRTISMEPNIKRNSLLFVTPIPLKPHRGDMYTVDFSDNESRPLLQKSVDAFTGFFTFQKIRPFSKSLKMSDASFIRRIAAVPGDTIFMKDYILYVRPKGEKHFLTEFELTESPYNVDIMIPPNEWDVSVGPQGSFSEITLGRDEYFVLCDNRLSSIDSRLFGCVRESSIKKRVLMAYFPFRHIRLF